MENFKLPIGIYGITDSKSGKNKDLITYCEELLKGGVKILQYREKNKNIKEKIEEAIKLRELTKKYNTLFIVNDHIDVALLSQADGIHIGQDDIPVSYARKLLGNKKIIGLSTHNKEQALKAIEDGVNYIGVGPIFNTETKVDVCAPVGFEYLNYVKNNTNIPFVAIGGIKENNILSVLENGATSIALVSELVGNKDTLNKTKNINNLIHNFLSK
ncbi:thiamine phosphate synthase [uncultured Cetobacterium sp.]|uniref:thiamine phosphate synthase n=1 Tax=uncultured Cetobacterium sp. TaxID=527638 RepID=UPI0026165244|nr:thiamine phosphate synthase [uncultured Cetobacterium sp.]